jgi:hypothetical protein
MAYLNIGAIAYYFFGALQMLGFNIIDPFAFPFLAHNPLERWKRWNVYQARWYRNMLFIPVQKWTGSIFLSLFVVFSFFASLHFKGIDIAKIVVGDFDLIDKKTVIGYFIFAGLNIISLYLAFLLPSLFGRIDRKSGWLGVLLTWTILCFVYSFRPPF